jgi:dihydroneopterin aldolase
LTAANDRPDRILVHNFVLPAEIGILEHEYGRRQDVRFSVTVDLPRGTAEPTGVEEVFSYDIITEGIRGILAAGHIDFVEALAERVAALVLADPRPLRVTVRVEKLEIIPGGSVGIEITRERVASAR